MVRVSRGGGSSGNSGLVWETIIRLIMIIYFLLCQATVLQTGDEASWSIILAGPGLLVKLLIAIEPRNIS